MKINEKNLSAFAVTPPADLEGFLNKRGEVNKAWQKRYFVLKGNLLFYFERKGDKEPLGVIIVEGCTIELIEDVDQCSFSFQIAFSGNRTYILSADTQETMERWMKALTCAGYEYKKLMVAELRRQLEEIEESQKKRLDQSQQSVSTVTPKPPPRRQNPFNRPAPPPPVGVAPVHHTDKSNNNITSTTASSIANTSVEVGQCALSASASDVARTPVANRDTLNLASSSFYVKATPTVPDSQATNDGTQKTDNFQRLQEHWREAIYRDIYKYWDELKEEEEKARKERETLEVMAEPLIEL